MKNAKWLLSATVRSAVAGAATGAIIFLFKTAAGAVIGLSEHVYSTVRGSPTLLPLLIVGAVAAGVAASLLLKAEPDARGGGIPGAIAVLRGLVPIRPIKNLTVTFASVMLTFLCGVPLGSEGPAVIMGTSVGAIACGREGCPDRYVMTGGACAGFAAATGAPVCGILFAFEEAHRKGSPMMLLTSGAAVVTGMLTCNSLCRLSGIGTALFHIADSAPLPLRDIWVPTVIGIVCGLLSVAFTRLHRAVGDLLDGKLSRIPRSAVICTLFAACALLGFISGDFIGTGHHLAERLIASADGVHLMLICLAVRAIAFISANNGGVTGGAFIPSLAIGAIIGSICGCTLVSAGVMDDTAYPLAVTLAMAAFLGAVSNTPLIAICFGYEVLGGATNTFPFITACFAASLVMAVSGCEEFADRMIEKRVRSYREIKDGCKISGGDAAEAGFQQHAGKTQNDQVKG